MESNYVYEISVKAMVEFLLKYGDISKGNKVSQNSERAQYGSQIHRKLQKEFGEIKGYTKEAAVKYTYEKNSISLAVNGRADGYYISNGVLYLDEIKTVEFDLTYYEESDLVHLAQAVCYAYIIASSDKINCEVSLIYYNIYNDDRKRISKLFTFNELESFFNNICESYITWLSLDIKRHDLLFEQLSKYDFPFDSYRDGQRQLCVSVYKAIVNKYKLYVQAPTGIGKTISVLFPSLKALVEKKISKIFFLTSRNAGILAPQDTLLMINEEVPDLSFITLTAKEKICFNGGVCEPENCIYAKGHFDRINQAVFECINKYKIFTREIIEDLAREYVVCPFEFALDISLWVDVIICDYNYLFDPLAYLKRFFADPKDYVFLVDEAHNLQDRTRDMYTQKLSKSTFVDLKKKFKDINKGKIVVKQVSNVIKHFNEIKEGMQNNNVLVTVEYDANMYTLIEYLCSSLGEFLSEEGTDDTSIMEIYFNCLFFLKLLDMYDDSFSYYSTVNGNDVNSTVYLANPSNIIREITKRGISTVFFSGTLEPLQFYFTTLGGNKEDRLIRVKSPFPQENKLVLIGNDIATTYRRRHFFYKQVADYILALTMFNKGNFLVFFSSYKYLSDVVGFLPSELMDETIVIQPKTQDPFEREKFIEDFLPNPQSLRIGLCVLGGIYSEGIDLSGDRLSGVIVIGVGLPQVCLERDIIKAVYERQDPSSGFLNTYLYPGLNKVLQASGRLIRTSTDRGFILLLDERFAQSSYLSLLPEDMNPKIINSVNDCIEEIKKFVDE